MKLIPYETDLSGMDCHMHSRFSPDANQCGADEPQRIADAVRERGLRGFIVTDHIDVGHWLDYPPIDFDKYFTAWYKVKKANPDLTIYIGSEVGFEAHTAEQSYSIIKDLPFEYIINSVHYWHPNENFKTGKYNTYKAYLECIKASLDAPYEFSTIGHLGFPERYAPRKDYTVDYQTFKPLMDEIIDKALARKVRFEENTNAGGEMRLPRADFLKAYRAKGGLKPMLGSDAHNSAAIGQHFAAAQKFLDEIFD